MTHKKAKRAQAAQPARMPVWLLASGAVLLAIVAVAIWAIGAAEPVPSGGRGPQLTVSQDRIDFGKVVYDKPVRAEFKLQNSGDSVLTLDATTPVRVVEGC